MTSPYYSDDDVTLYLGDMREILPALNLRADVVIADPPYQSTSLAWDRWPDAWPAIAATVTNSLWCFGTIRMFLDRHQDFTGWQLAQDIVWEKSNGSAASTPDRFRRVHEHALHWYRGKWADVHHEAPRVAAPADKARRNGSAVRTSAPQHAGEYGPARRWTETGTRLMRSVIPAQSLRGRAIHPTQKPLPVLVPLVESSCPPGGLVVDPFAGSGSTLDAARQCGRRAVGIEADERYLDAAARRLQQTTLIA